MPRQFLRELIPMVHPDWPVLRTHIPAMLGILATMSSFYLLGAYVGSGPASYICSAVIMALLFLTALARLNVIEHTRVGFRWQFRRFGWLAIIVTSMGVTLVEINHPPTWREVLFRLGWLAIVMTTPMMPPWHRFMAGATRKVVVEVPADAEVAIVRTESADGMYQEDRRKDRVSAQEPGP